MNESGAAPRKALSPGLVSSVVPWGARSLQPERGPQAASNTRTGVMSAMRPAVRKVLNVGSRAGVGFAETVLRMSGPDRTENPATGGLIQQGTRLPALHLEHAGESLRLDAPELGALALLFVRSAAWPAARSYVESWERKRKDM